MKRIGLLALILAVVSVGVVFADIDDDSDFESMPKNTITVDIGPLIVGSTFASLGASMGGDDAGIDFTGFGIAAQYERQLQEKLSVAGRFSYLSVGMGMSDSQGGSTVKFTMEFVSFSIEGHIRFYPFVRTFFLDGMLGYANLAINFNGEMFVTGGGIKYREKVSLTMPRDYFKCGAKIGWRIDFGNHGGFVFEPSFGWYGGIPLGDTIGKKLSKELGGDVTDIDESLKYLEEFMFIGGPRISLAFGFRF